MGALFQTRGDHQNYLLTPWGFRRLDGAIRQTIQYLMWKARGRAMLLAILSLLTVGFIVALTGCAKVPVIQDQAVPPTQNFHIAWINNYAYRVHDDSMHITCYLHGDAISCLHDPPEQ